LLAPRQWAPDNHRQLNAWLATVSTSDEQVTAVFDWDNTCVYGDIGEATFRHQLATLALRLTPDEMAAHIPRVVNGVTTLEGGVSLAALREDILTSYHALWSNISAGTQAEVLKSSAHKDLQVRLAFLYEALTQTEGIGPRFSYPWVTGFAAGMTVAEIHALAASAVEHALQVPQGVMTWQAASPGVSGVMVFSYERGFCPQPEMLDLIKAAQRAGVEVFVVTASLEYVVEGAAKALAYPVDEAHVMGMRPRLDADGRLTIHMDERVPMTYREGKVAVIERLLPSPPQLVAGDSNTDFEMLTRFDATSVRVVINRNKSGDIRSLYDDPKRALLQGRDENACAFRPARETIPRGDTQPVMLP